MESSRRRWGEGEWYVGERWGWIGVGNEGGKRQEANHEENSAGELLGGEENGEEWGGYERGVEKEDGETRVQSSFYVPLMIFKLYKQISIVYVCRVEKFNNITRFEKFMMSKLNMQYYIVLPPYFIV